MSLESAHQRAQLWLRQARDDLKAAQVLQIAGQAAQSCFQSQQVGKKARLLDKLYAPTRYPDALGDEVPADVFGPEDSESALQAASELLDWVANKLNKPS